MNNNSRDINRIDPLSVLHGNELPVAPDPAFAARLQEGGTSVAEAAEEDADPLTGVELAELCHSKYGKFHDMAIKHVTINKSGMRRWVALNIYGECACGGRAGRVGD